MFAAASLVATSVAADDRAWSVEAGAAYAVHVAAQPAGGLAATLAARRWGAVGERARVFVGVDAALVGLATRGGPGLVAGPELGADYRIGDAWRAGATIALDVGSLPVDGAARWGFFPRAQASVSYALSPAFALVAGVGARYVTTPAWTGASVEPAISARVGW